MIVPTITYLVFALSGLLGSAIAWDDLRKATRNPEEKAKAA